MEKIIIKVIHLAPFKLLGKYPFIVLCTLYHKYRHLGSDGKGISGIAFCYQLAEGFLAVPSVIDIGGIKISESRLHIFVYHGSRLFQIHA